MRYAAHKFLRSPKVIVGELLALTLACSLGAALPQAGTATPAELVCWHDAGPLAMTLARLLSLDHIFRSGWFFTVTALTCISLAMIILEQMKRLRSQWLQPLSEVHFRNAPFQAEFERIPVHAPTLHTPRLCPRLHIWTERRLGLLGSPLLHLGILIIVVAGALRALFGTEAVVDLVEGETLPPTAAAWPGQSPGVLGRPFRLDSPVALDAVKVTRYPDGDLRELKVRLSLHSGVGAQPAELAVNHDIDTAQGRIFLGSDFGPTALVEWQSAGAAVKRQAALLAEKSRNTFEGASAGPNGLQAYLRARLGVQGTLPESIEVRVMRDGALLFTGDMCPGQTVTLRSGERLLLHGTPFWVRLRGSRDRALGLAYFGFALVMTGALLIFGVVKVDACVIVTPLGERERVFVALKPQRFAPLYEERFEQLVREAASGSFTVESSVHLVGWLRSTSGIRCKLCVLRVSVFHIYARNLPTVPCAINSRPCSSAAALPHCARSASMTPLRLAAWLFLAILILSLTGCQRSSIQQARQLVERYNEVVSEAYRRSDVDLVDSVVGPNEGKKLTGLIGVRLDLGLTLDSQMLSLEITGVEKSKNELRVTTRERWRYRDRKIGTGEQVGEESLDAYEMLYVFKRTGKTWLVDEIRFTSPPQVGRKQTTWLASREPLPGHAETTQETKVQQQVHPHTDPRNAAFMRQGPENPQDLPAKAGVPEAVGGSAIQQP